jgi:toxin ParE1/3/4
MGEDQAKRYVSALRHAIKALREFPLRHPEFDPRPGLRRLNTGRHAVFYRVTDEQIEIVRVLHVARDLSQII